MNTVATVWFLMRYGIVGAVGGVLQTLTLYIWVDILQKESHYLWGAVIGFCIALLVTFTLQKYWTFNDRDRTSMHYQFFFYTSIALASLALNLFFLHVSKTVLEALGFDFFRTWYLLAQITSVGVVAAFSFITNYFITFRTTRV